MNHHISDWRDTNIVTNHIFSVGPFGVELIFSIEWAEDPATVDRTGVICKLPILTPENEWFYRERTLCDRENPEDVGDKQKEWEKRHRKRSAYQEDHPLDAENCP